MALKLWLRDELKKTERRSALSPTDVQKLQQAGIDVVVEKSDKRIFKDSEYEALNCQLTQSGSWKNAPLDYTIIGLKELEIDHDFSHKHIYFAHIYKGQTHAKKILSQYESGGGTLFDLEFLVDKNQTRVVAFGHWAGYVGMALSLDRYYQRANGLDAPYKPLSSFHNKEELLKQISNNRNSSNLKDPRTMIIGAKGRCGRGALELLNHFKLSATQWDYEQTKKGGPFNEVLEHEIFINTVLLNQKIAPFIHSDQFKERPFGLKVIGDVSCDPESENNPIQVYNQHTTWDKPFLRKFDQVDILAVDNLPSILPLESSEDFSNQLLPHLIELHQHQEGILPTPFQKALEVFNNKKVEILS